MNAQETIRPDGAARACLIDSAAATGSQPLFLDKARIQVGRSPSNDIVIDAKTVSGAHAVIEKKQEGFFLVDLNSTNGTRLNGVAIDPSAPRKLSDGDEIFFDVFSFVFRLEAPILPRSAPSRPSSGGISSRPPEADEDRAAASEEDLPDTQPSKIGPYDVLILLGQGGFGTVWQAKDASGKAVAVKVLNPDALKNEKAVRKFFHEAIILSKMDHPNICNFIDFFPYGRNYAIVMDFISGVDLMTCIKREKAPLPIETACRIAVQTLDAFHYAHQMGVLHRDIKPENIILDADGTAKVMDFGIAKLSSSATQQTAIYMLSTGYTAPERFDIQNVVDHRADIYSLGIVFYEIFTGTHPFGAQSPPDMVYAHINTLPDPPDEIVDLPKEISQAILKAIEKDPADRFDDFAAFKAALLGRHTLKPECSGPSSGGIEFPDGYYRIGGALLKTYANIVQKYQQMGRKFSVIQTGTQFELIIETKDGDSVKIIKDLKKVGGGKRGKQR